MKYKTMKSRGLPGDAALREAAGQVRRAMLENLPEPEDCVWDVSPALESTMQDLIRRRKKRLDRLPQSIVAAVLTLCLLGGAVLLFHPEARAGFVTWLRELTERRVHYQFFGETPPESIPQYGLSFVPEGYVPIEDWKTDVGGSAVYEHELTGSLLVFEYYLLSADLSITLQDSPEDYSITDVTVGDVTGQLYEAEIPEDSNYLLWIDETAGMVFTINGYLDKTVIVDISRHVELSE